MHALVYNTTGSENTAEGYKTLHGNTTQYNNTAAGYHPLFTLETRDITTPPRGRRSMANPTGNENVAIGGWM
jgi:hypothetical protein